MTEGNISVRIECNPKKEKQTKGIFAMDNGIKLSDKLTVKKKNIYDGATAEDKARIFDFSEAYKEFLDKAKTEREAAEYAIDMVKAAGFTEYKLGSSQYLARSRRPANWSAV